MNNKTILTLTMLFCANSVFASYLWNINTGINEFYKGNYNYSKTFFTTYLKSNPNDADGYWWLAKSYQKLQDEKNAILNFEKSYAAAFSKNEIEKINFNPSESSNIEDYFDMATDYFSKGNYKEADFYADMMLKLDSKSASAYFVKAKIAKTLKNDEEAKEYLKQAIIYNNDILKTNLAKVLNITSVPTATKTIYKYSAQELYYKGELKEAISNAKKYLELEKNIDMINFLVNLYIKNGEIAPATTYIEEAKNAGIANIQTYILEAQTLNDDEKTEKVLLEAYKINPNNQDVLLNLGNLYLRKQDYANALKYFETLNAVNSDLYEGYFGLAYSRLKLNKTEESLDLVREMNKKNPIASENLFLLSLVAQNQKGYTEAIEYLDEAIKKDENANYYFEKAKIYYLLKNYAKSLENLQLASKRGNIADNAEFSEYYVKNYIKLDKPKEAQKLISYLIELDKNRIIYKYYLYNLCKLDSNNYSNCQKTFKMPKPTTSKDYFDISEILFEKDNLKEALKTLNTGLKQYSDSAELLNQKNKLDYYYDKH